MLELSEELSMLELSEELSMLELNRKNPYKMEYKACLRLLLELHNKQKSSWFSTLNATPRSAFLGISKVRELLQTI